MISLGLTVEYLVFIKERRTADKDQFDRLRAGVLKRVPVTSGDVNGVAGINLLNLIADSHKAPTRNQIIDLLDIAMIMRRDGASGREHFFSQAALSYIRRGPINKRPNLGAMSCIDDARVLAIHNNH